MLLVAGLCRPVDHTHCKLRSHPCSSRERIGIGKLQKQRIQFKSLTDSIDTGTASGRFFFHVMASLAEMERELTIERTRAGLEVARRLGRVGGRKRLMTESRIKSAKKLLASGVPPRDVAANLGVSVPTLYRWIPAPTDS